MNDDGSTLLLVCNSGQAALAFPVREAGRFDVIRLRASPDFALVAILKTRTWTAAPRTLAIAGA